MLHNDTILITGGGSGIGKALAILLATDNRVIICGRSEEKLKHVCSMSGTITHEVVDVSDPASVDTMFASLKKKGIIVNVLINNAGVVETWDIRHDTFTSQEIFQKINTNLSGAIAITQQFIRQADQQVENLIVNNTSEIAIMPVPILMLYSASKTALSVFTRSLRIQLKKTNFKVMELLPPGVDTEMPKKLRNKAKLISPEEFAREVVKNIRNGKAVYAGGRNVLLFKLFRSLAPNLGLTIIDRLSRKQLG